MMVCGTGVGVTWTTSLDHRTIGTGRIGPVATALRAFYDDVTRARINWPGIDARPVYAASARSESAPAHLDECLAQPAGA